MREKSQDDKKECSPCRSWPIENSAKKSQNEAERDPSGKSCDPTTNN